MGGGVDPIEIPRARDPRRIGSLSRSTAHFENSPGIFENFQKFPKISKNLSLLPVSPFFACFHLLFLPCFHVFFAIFTFLPRFHFFLPFFLPFFTFSLFSRFFCHFHFFTPFSLFFAVFFLPFFFFAVFHFFARFFIFRIFPPPPPPKKKFFWQNFRIFFQGKDPSQ